jgi:hypothetical protein
VLAEKVPLGDGWLHELKHDGFRIVAHKDGERVHLWSRNGRDWSVESVAIVAAVRALPFAPAARRFSEHLDAKLGDRGVAGGPNIQAPNPTDAIFLLPSSTTAREWLVRAPHIPVKG